MIYTSLDQIAAFRPCPQGWKLISRECENAGIVNSAVEWPISAALKSNSISDVLWLLGNLGRKDICVEFAQFCADSVAHLRNPEYVNTAAASAAANATDAANAADASASAVIAADAAYAATDAANAASVAAAYAAVFAARVNQKNKLAELLDAAV